MKTLKFNPVFVVMGVLLCGPVWNALTPGPATCSAQAPLYNPPIRGAPVSRVGGGTRGLEDDRPSVIVLAPDHVGLTTHTQPELYWYLSKDSHYPVSFSLNDATSIEPILETVLPPPIKAGIHRIQLANYEIRLQPDVVYDWFINVVMSADDPSPLVVAGGAIKYMGPDNARAQHVNRALKAASDPTQAWRLYAASGIWYDAVAALSQRIRQTSQAAELLNQRTTLLKEIGISEFPSDAKQYP